MRPTPLFAHTCWQNKHHGRKRAHSAKPQRLRIPLCSFANERSAYARKNFLSARTTRARRWQNAPRKTKRGRQGACSVPCAQLIQQTLEIKSICCCAALCDFSDPIHHLLLDVASGHLRFCNVAQTVSKPYAVFANSLLHEALRKR